MKDEYVNMLFNKYKNIVDKIAKDNNYDDNIKHLLWLIMTSFVLKYGIKNESTILKCFRETIIIKKVDFFFITAMPVFFSANPKSLESAYFLQTAKDAEPKHTPQ